MLQTVSYFSQTVKVTLKLKLITQLSVATIVQIESTRAVFLLSR